MIRILISHFVLSMIGILTIFLQWFRIGETTRIILAIVETLFVSIAYIKIGQIVKYEYDEGFKTWLRIFSISMMIVLGGVADSVWYSVTGVTNGIFLSNFLNLPFMPLYAIFQCILHFKYGMFLFIFLGILPSTLIFAGYHFKTRMR